MGIAIRDMEIILDRVEQEFGLKRAKVVEAAPEPEPKKEVKAEEPEVEKPKPSSFEEVTPNIPKTSKTKKAKK